MTRGHVVRERLIQTLTCDYTSARCSGGSAPRGSGGRGSPSAAACGLEAGASLGPMTAARANGGDILRASSCLNQLPKPKDRLRVLLSGIFASDGYPKPQEGSKKIAQEGPERGNPWGASGARAGQGLGGDGEGLERARWPKTTPRAPRRAHDDLQYGSI